MGCGLVGMEPHTFLVLRAVSGLGWGGESVHLLVELSPSRKSWLPQRDVLMEVGLVPV